MRLKVNTSAQIHYVYHVICRGNEFDLCNCVQYSKHVHASHSTLIKMIHAYRKVSMRMNIALQPSCVWEFLISDLLEKEVICEVVQHHRAR